MRISDAKSESRDVAVRFETGDLNVTYRPISYTINEAERLTSESSDLAKATPEQRAAKMSQLATTISNLVVAWDLEDDEGVTIDPQNAEALRDVPMNIFNEVIRAINEDQKPSGKRKGPGARPGNPRRHGVCPLMVSRPRGEQILAGAAVGVGRTPRVLDGDSLGCTEG